MQKRPDPAIQVRGPVARRLARYCHAISVVFKFGIKFVAAYLELWRISYIQVESVNIYRYIQFFSVRKIKATKDEVR